MRLQLFFASLTKVLGRDGPIPWEMGSSVSLSPAASASAEREQRGTHRALKAPQKKTPTQLLMLSPAGAALGAKKKKSEEKGFFSLCIIAVQPHLFLQYAWHQAPVTAIPTPSSASAPPHDTGAAAARAADGFRRCSPS